MIEIHGISFVRSWSAPLSTSNRDHPYVSAIWRLGITPVTACRQDAVSASTEDVRVRTLRQVLTQDLLPGVAAIDIRE